MAALFEQLSSLGRRRLMEFFTDAALPLAPERVPDLFAPATADDLRRIAESLNAATTAASDPPPSPAAPPPVAPQTATDFANRLNTAAPEQVRQLAGSLNAAEHGGAARSGKTCPRCKRNRTDADLTCPHCGYTEWVAIISGSVFGVALLLAALFWAPAIETAWLQWAIRWGGGLLGALIVLVMPFAAVKGLRAAGKPVSPGPDSAPAAPSPPGVVGPARSAPAPSGAQNVAGLLTSLDEGGSEPPAAVLNNSSPAGAKEPARRLAAASPDPVGKKTSGQAEGAEASRPGRGSAQPPASDATAIPFGCPACGRMLRVKAEMAGNHAKCPGCKQRIQIPRKSRE